MKSSSLGKGSALSAIVKALAAESKTRPSRVTSLERDTLVILEVENVAISVKPLGTVCGVQLAAVFQSPLVGLRFQVALPAELGWLSRCRKSVARSAVIANDGMECKTVLLSVMAGCCCMVLDLLALLLLVYRFAQIDADSGSEVVIAFNLWHLRNLWRNSYNYCTVSVRSLPVPPS